MFISAPSPRMLFASIFLICAVALGFGLYLQAVHNLLACPLCVVQRIAYLGAGGVALAAALHGPVRDGNLLYAAASFGFSLLGLVVAGRQVWMISRPVFADCGISPEEQVLNSLPLAQWWPQMFQANGDCAKVTWSFLGWSVPELSFMVFAVITFATLKILTSNRG